MCWQDTMVTILKEQQQQMKGEKRRKWKIHPHQQHQHQYKHRHPPLSTSKCTPIGKKRHGNNNSSSSIRQKNQFCLTLVKRMASLLNIHWSYNPSLSCSVALLTLMVIHCWYFMRPHYYKCCCCCCFICPPYYSRLSLFFPLFWRRRWFCCCHFASLFRNTLWRFAHLLFTVANTLFIWNRNSVVGNKTALSVSVCVCARIHINTTTNVTG